MSFGTYARRVRNPALPYDRRAATLKSCVRCYSPFGYRATLSYLAATYGPWQNDEPALLRALDALTASRAGWLRAVGDYAATRRAAKRDGHRTPSPREPSPFMLPQLWYGPDRPAATLHALDFWHRDRLPDVLAATEPEAADVHACVVAALATGGALTPTQRAALAGAVPRLRRRFRTPAATPQTRSLLVLARLAEISSARTHPS